MGAKCCVAASDKPQTSGAQLEVSAHRNVRHSPSWSFRWDNRTHIEDIMDHPSRFAHQNSGDIQPAAKGRVAMTSEHLSDVGQSLDGFQTIELQKTSRKTEASGHIKTGITDQSMETSSSAEVKDITEPPTIAGAILDTKPSTSIPSTPSALSSRSCLSLPADPDLVKKARHSPGYRLERQVSDNLIPSLKYLNESRDDLSAGGSYGGSSDGWSRRTFTELVASSRKERRSIDSETISSIDSKQQLVPLSPGRQACKICSKPLERSVVAANVIAVLVCGHVYHADCLEKVTPEADKFDPPCPLCEHGEEQTAKLLEKIESKVRGRVSWNAVADIDGNSEFQHRKRGRGPKVGASSSMKRPLLRRHFSIGSWPARLLSEGESARKKGFWARYFKE